MTEKVRSAILPTLEWLLERYFRLPEAQRRREFVPVKEAAFRAGVHPTTISRWIAAKRIPAIPLGRRRLVWLPGFIRALKSGM